MRRIKSTRQYFILQNQKKKKLLNEINPLAVNQTTNQQIINNNQTELLISCVVTFARGLD